MTMELKIPIEIVLDDVSSAIIDLSKLQTYKLCEGDDMTLVDAHDVIGVLMRHIKAREAHGMRGRWIYGEDERLVKCSRCGMETTRNELKGIALFGKKEPNFCPNCGARMEGAYERLG